MLGRLKEIGRYPIKSMLGEAPQRVAVSASGLAGDRAHALIDVATGKVAAAKDPRLWASLLGLRAAYVGDPKPGAPIAITFADGQRIASTDPDLEAQLSNVLGRSVRLSPDPSATAAYDSVWEVDDIAPAEVVAGSRSGTTESGRPVSTMPLAMMAPGTFQDVAPITLMTTAALAAMAREHPGGRWEQARFRNNFVIDVPGAAIVENDWIGRRIAIGSAVIEVTSAAPRCVMTTLAQDGLPRDIDILKTVARVNKIDFAGFGKWACLGAYARVVEPGEVAVGDAVVLR